MIDKQLLKQTVEDAIKGTPLFIVDVSVSPDNSIVVEIDSPESIDTDTCAEITRKIEAVFDRDVEDYDLEVGSSGLTTPFKVKGQYLKNIGNEIEVLTNDFQKLRGVLKEVADDDFTIEIAKKEKKPGAKRPEVVKELLSIRMADTKEAKYLIKFK